MSDTQKKDGNSALILGVPISGKSKGQLLTEIESLIDKDGNFEHKSAAGVSSICLIFTPNPEILVLSARDNSFKHILERADINIPDGVGIVIASMILRLFGKAKSGQTISTSLTGTDLSHDLIMLAAQKGQKVFYLGGMPGVAEEAGRMLEREAKESGEPFSPNFAWATGRPEDDNIVEVINAFEPDLLFVALGQGKQERWLMEHRDILKVKVGMVVGGAIDFWSGRVRRAPLLMRKLGLEWLFRLIVEPWRWRRQLKLFEFGWLVLRDALS